MSRYRPKVAVMAAMAAGRRCVDKGDLRRAIACFERATRIDPSSAQAFLYRAGLKLLAGDDAGALADFNAIAGLDHSYLPAYRDLTTLSAEEFPALVPAVERLLERDPACAWGWVFRAFSLRSLMRYEDAIVDLDEALACAPASAALYAMRSRVKLTNRRDFYDGVKDMETAVRLQPDWGWLHCWLGEALRHQGKFDAALSAFDRGLELEPRYKRGYAWRGGTRVAVGRWKEALSDLKLSLAFDPIYHYDFEYTADQKSWAYNQKMLARRGLGDTAGALRELNAAHLHGPRYLWLYNPGNDAAVSAARLSELDAEVAARPRSAWARAWRGWTRAQAGAPAAALSDIEAALLLAPKAGWVWAWKGRVQFLLGDPLGSRKSLDRALVLDPSYAPAWGWRGESNRKLSRLKAAVSDFSRAIRLDHRAAWAFGGRGECRQAMGQAEAARADLDRALAICPEYPQAQAWRAAA